MPMGPAYKSVRRRLFMELMVWMMGLGLVAGMVFPPFVALLGIPESLVYKPGFYAACLSAGLMVGALNFLAAWRVVQPRVKLLSDGMHRFRLALLEEQTFPAMSGRTAECFHVPVDSLDDMGRAAESFNRLVDALMRARRMEESVRDFSQTLAAQLDLAPLCREALSVMLARTGAVAGALFVLRDGTLECAAAHGLSAPDTLTTRDDVQSALRDLRTRQVEVPAGLPLAGGLEDQPREMLLLPLEHKHEPMGLLILASPHPFTPEIFRLLDFFRQSLKLALQNALSHERLGRIAAVDPLTGCYNRRMGMQRLAEEFSRTRRSRVSLGLVMFDIDHFKPVNDTWGHLVGDRILVQTAQAVQRVLRAEDILVRFGGEEFLILLPGTGLDESVRVSERVRVAVESMAVVGEGPERITVSVGVGATADLVVRTGDALLQRVDEALYKAKSRGRNRVTAVSRTGFADS